MFNNHPTFVRTILGVVCAIATLATASAVEAASINFDTNAAGVPYTGLGSYFTAGEYAGLGVTFNDSDPATGLTYVNQINPANVGTAISGYYVNVGAFTGTSTFLDLQFSTPITSLMFDFATPDGKLGVIAYGSGGSLLDTVNLVGTNPFLNQTGAPVKAGLFSLSGVGPISHVVINPSANETLIFDNLQFTPVPLPAAAWLLGSGLLGLGAVARRKLRTK